MVEYRSVNGFGNNLVSPTLGQTDTALTRVSANAYSDGVSTMAGADRPSPRVISNAVMAQKEAIDNPKQLSDLFWLWGQFIAHDLSLTETADQTETANISVPAGDPYFDPYGSGKAEIKFERSAFEDGSGSGKGNPREQVNQITAFMDGSQIYGSTQSRYEQLMGSDGKFKMSDGNLLQFNVDGLPNAMTTSASHFLAGDVRANENVGLTSLHTIFVREHNRLVDELSVEYPEWDGKTLAHEARKIVEAELQIITYKEYLPKLIGVDAIADWSGYQADIDPQVSNEFSTAAFRLGHTLLSSRIERVEEYGSESEYGHLSLRDAFFRPDRLVNEGGVDDVLRGAAVGKAQKLDSQIIDDVRNFLFGAPGQGGFDLASLNIQRGRDHGLDDYNSVREAYGLARVEGFAEITSDVSLQAELAKLYGTVDNIDLYVAGLMEDPVPGSLLGETFQRIVVDQFVRTRDGDRFWHENQLTEAELRDLSDVSLADIIERNSEIDYLQDDLFTSYGRIAGYEDDDILVGWYENGLVAGHGGDDILTGVEGTQQLEGGEGRDHLYGGAGDDVIYGGADEDVLLGEGGDDKLHGGVYDDHLNGGDGADILNGGGDDDYMIGGSGCDTFVISTGQDVISDYSVGEDILDFSEIDSINSVDDLTIHSYSDGTLISDNYGNNTWLSGIQNFASVSTSFDSKETTKTDVSLEVKAEESCDYVDWQEEVNTACWEPEEVVCDGVNAEIA